MRDSQGFWGTREHWQNIEGNKGTLGNFCDQGNKIRKITLRKHSENVWKHGNIGQFWKGTRKQGNKDPLGDPHQFYLALSRHAGSHRYRGVTICSKLRVKASGKVPWNLIYIIKLTELVQYLHEML